MSEPPRQIGVLFVCLGNICRSPTAEGIFASLADQRGVLDRFRIDSAGTGGWHSGKLPDPRARATALRNGLELTHIARTIDPVHDIAPPPVGFDWFIGMDLQNCSRLLSLGAAPARVRLLRSFDPLLHSASQNMQELPDPYPEPDETFDEVFAMARRACEGLLTSLMNQ